MALRSIHYAPKMTMSLKQAWIAVANVDSEEKAKQSLSQLSMGTEEARRTMTYWKSWVTPRLKAFYNHFVDRLRGDVLKDYYFFIIMKTQEKSFHDDIKRAGMDKCIHYESEWRTNANYPNDRGRLKLYVFKMPEDYNPEDYKANWN